MVWKAKVWPALLVLGIASCAGDDAGSSTKPSTMGPVGGMQVNGGAAAPAGGIGGAAMMPGGPVVTGGMTGSAGGGPVVVGGMGGMTGSAGAMPGAGNGAAGNPMAGSAAEAGSGGMMAGEAGSAPPVTLPPGEGPKLPDIQGECPVFANGMNIMAAGHRSIAIMAGEAGKGGALLFYWHGTGGSAAEAMRTLPAGVRNEIISGGGIIAAFNGNSSSGAEGDCSGTAAHNMADFKAADVIAACAVKNHGIDSRRIYSTGCSAGGLQTGCMAQMRSSYLAAVAPNSGGVVFPQQWQDMHSPAVFTMHGGSSDVVIVTFSETSKTFDMAAKTHGSFVVNCDHGGRHCGAPPELQTAAWEFMKAHPWGIAESPWKSGIPSNIPDYCKIF